MWQPRSGYSYVAVHPKSSMLPNWYFDEFNMAGVDFEDTAQVEAYDRNQTISTPDKEQALVEQLGIVPGQTVIDLGGGTGTFAIQAALAGAQVHAVDVSQAMLTYVQNKSRKAGVSTLQFHRAGFLTYEHQNNLADVSYYKKCTPYSARLLEDDCFS